MSLTEYAYRQKLISIIDEMEIDGVRHMTVAADGNDDNKFIVGFYVYSSNELNSKLNEWMTTIHYTIRKHNPFSEREDMKSDVEIAMMNTHGQVPTCRVEGEWDHDFDCRKNSYFLLTDFGANEFLNIVMTHLKYDCPEVNSVSIVAKPNGENRHHEEDKERFAKRIMEEIWEYIRV